MKSSKQKITIYLPGEIPVQFLTQSLAKNFVVEQLPDFDESVLLLTAQTSVIHTLKDRELEILNHLKQGLTYQEIAPIYDITIDGVRYYIKSIYKKLGVSNARQAIALI